MIDTPIRRRRAESRALSARASIPGAVTAVLLVTALVPSPVYAEQQTDETPTPWSVAGVYTAASPDSGTGPPMAFAAAGVDRFSIKFLNIGPWWEVLPRVHFRFDETLELSFGAGIQQFRAAVSPRIEIGARGKLGVGGFY